MSTYTNIDWSGLTAGVNRIAENNRNRLRSEYSAGSSVHAADTQANTQKYIAETQDVRERELAKEERQLRESIADKDREGRKEVAKINAGASIVRDGFKIIPTLFATKPNNSNKGGTGNTKPSNATLSPAVDSGNATVAKPVTIGEGALPTFRSGNATISSNKEATASDQSGFTSQNLLKTISNGADVVKKLNSKVGPALGTAAALAIPAVTTLMSFAL